MTTPSQKLKQALKPSGAYLLKAEDGSFIRHIEYAEAVRLAGRGEIEGVCSSSGRVRYLRVLPESARQVPSEDIMEVGKRTPLNAVTNMGAYRQHLEHGVIWALCQCKALDGARA